MSDHQDVAGGVARLKIAYRPVADRWAWIAVAVAVVAALPVLVVLGHLALPVGEDGRHLAATVLPGYLFNSLALMLLVGAGTALGGVATAWTVTMCRFPGRDWFDWALLLPMAMPAYILAYTYAGLLDVAGPVQSTLRALYGWQPGDYWFPPIRSLAGAALMLTLVLYPYVYLLARSAFLSQSICVLEVSRTLGCSALQSFFRVGLPLARPAIAAGLALVLMETLNDYGTVQHFAVDTLTAGMVRSWLGMGNPGLAAQLGAVTLLFVLALVGIERASRRQVRFHHTTGRYRSLPGHRLSRSLAILAILVCATPILLGFALPGGLLLHWAIMESSSVFDRRFVGFAANSLSLAGAAAVLAMMVAVLLAQARRLSGSWLVHASVALAGLGYAVPGAVVAIGLLLPLGMVGGWLGVTLTGTAGALIYAYVVRFMGAGFGAVEAGFAKITPSIDRAARNLARGPIDALWRVHLPMVRPSLLTGALLVFVDVMKELPATLVIRPFNFDTLAIRAYQLAADERLREAAGPGLAIVAVGILPVIALSRMIAASRPGAHLPPS